MQRTENVELTVLCLMCHFMEQPLGAHFQQPS